MYVKITEGKVEKLFYSVKEFREAHLELSIPKNISDNDLKSYGVYKVIELPEPKYNHRTHKAVTQPPELIDGEWTMSSLVMPKEQIEIDNENEQKKHTVRLNRNMLLSVCDWTQLADAPVNKDAWATYRQALRDITAQEGFPWDVTWPVQPE